MRTILRSLSGRDKDARAILVALVLSNLLVSAGPTLLALLDPGTTPIDFVLLGMFAFYALTASPLSQGVDSSATPAVALSVLSLVFALGLPYHVALTERVRHGIVAFASVQAALLCVAGYFMTVRQVNNLRRR